MLASAGRKTQTNELFDDLAPDALGILIPITIFVFWAWTSSVSLFDQIRMVHGYLALLAATACGLASAQLSQRHLQTAVALLLTGLAARLWRWLRPMARSRRSIFICP